MIRIELPWPPRELHPNARAHWAKQRRAGKTCRMMGAAYTLAAGIRRNDPDIPHPLKVTAVFYPPNNIRRDLDGMLSNIKSYLDGISDVIGVDDSKWSIAIRREAPVKGGSVRIEIERANG